jgi:NADPH:quinone reductase-like Zn-dependent oxidoreductase
MEDFIMDNMMRAIGFRRYGPAEVLEEFDVPRPVVMHDSVLIRVAAAGVNPADWRFRSGQFRFGLRLKLPFVPGSDIAGIVEQVGSAVKGFRPGDAVYAMLPTTTGGGYAEYAVASESLVAHMPNNITFAEAASVPLTALTALQALRDVAVLEPGMRVLINGASGGVGWFAVQIAKVFGARVTAVCSGKNMDVVRRLGVDEVLDYTKANITVGEAQYHVIFDAVNAHPFRRWQRRLRPGGQVVTVNPLAGKIRPRWLSYFQSGRRLKSVFVQPSGADLTTLGRWIAARHVRSLIDASYPLANAVAAHRYSETQRVRGKLVLVVDPSLASQTIASLLEQRQFEHQRFALPLDALVEETGIAVTVH